MNWKRVLVLAALALPVSLVVVSNWYAPDDTHHGNAKEYAARAGAAQRVVFQNAVKEGDGLLVYFQLWKDRTTYSPMTIQINSTHPFYKGVETAVGEYSIALTDNRVDDPTSPETDGSYLDIRPSTPPGDIKLIGQVTIISQKLPARRASFSWYTYI